MAKSICYFINKSFRYYSGWKPIYKHFPDKSFLNLMYVKLYLLSNCIRRHQRAVQFASFLFKIWVSNFKTTMPCNFWIDKELLICPKNFLKKSPCNFLFLQKWFGTWVWIEWWRNYFGNIARILNLWNANRIQLAINCKNQIIMKQKYKQYCRN
jgi:hypothetical protein